MRWAWIIELDSGPSGWIRLTSYSWMGWNPRKTHRKSGFPCFFPGKRPVGLPGKLRWIELLGLLAKLIMWWRQWGEIYSKLYGNAGEKMRRFERFDSKKMILEFLGVIIYLSNCFRVYVCSLICTCFVFLKSQEHQCRWGELEIISCSLHPVCEYVSCMWPLSSGFDASRRNPSNAQVWDVIRFSIAQREIVEKFQFHSMYFFPTKLGHPFFKKDLATHKPNLNPKIHPPPWCPPCPETGAIPLLLWKRPKVGRKSSWSERRNKQRPWPRAFPVVVGSESSRVSIWVQLLNWWVSFPNKPMGCPTNY